MQNTWAFAPIACCVLLTVMACGNNQNAVNRMRTPAPQAEQNASANPNAPGTRELLMAKRFYGAADFAKALESFVAAAEKGNADAQYYAGVMFADGQGTTRNFEEAAKWYEKAAEQNHADALYALARLYVFGNGVEPDSRKAVRLFERAAQAYPAGEERARAEEQVIALLAVLEESEAESAQSGDPKGEAPKSAPQAVKEAERR
jgi:TPR repeat protein